MSRKQFRARAVLFDWDGTLLNSYAADVRAYLAMFRALEVEWGVEDVARHYSPNWYHVYRAAKIPRAKWTAADRLWRNAYLAERPALLQGVRGVLRALRRKFVLGLVTSGSGDRVRRQICEFRLHEHFAVCVCSEDTLRKKPHPAPLQCAMRHLRVTREECVYVGDAPQDIEMARRAGVPSIGVLGPFPTAAGLRAARPDLLLESVRKLPHYLRVLG